MPDQAGKLSLGKAQFLANRKKKSRGGILFFFFFFLWGMDLANYI